VTYSANSTGYFGLWLGTDLLAARIGPATGITWIYGVAGSQKLRVTADGAWSVTVWPMQPPIHALPVSFAADYDQVTEPFSANGSVTFNLRYTGTGYFGVRLVSMTGASVALLANALDATQLTAHLSGLTGDYVLDVSADGPWSADMTTP
jgi:hypothetical protein